MQVSVVIPTYCRPDDLRRTIHSLIVQTCLPTELIVIDDNHTSDEDLAYYRSRCSSVGVDFIYHKKDHQKVRRGLSESKNLAFSLVEHEKVLIIDDDVELSEDCIEELLLSWDKFNNEQMIGVTGKVLNNRKQGILERFYHKLFFLTSTVPWDVLSTGFQVWDNDLAQTEKIYYSHGCLTMFKKSLSLQLKFLVFEGGRTGLEDVDFCLRAKKKGWFFVMNPSATLLHFQSPVSRESAFDSGLKESRNRIDIFKRLGDGNVLLFWWQMTGWIFRQALAGHFRKAAGMIRGLFL